MAKRHFCLLAHKYDDRKHNPAGWFMSQKCDGMRAIWLPATRGLQAAHVPFANTAKDARLVRPPVSTGLWSRYGNVIHAPGWWLDELPDYPLDGELYIGLNSFQELMSTVKDHVPGIGWQRVKYHVFDSPPVAMILSDGEINETNFVKKLSGSLEWYMNRVKSIQPIFPSFEQTLAFLRRELAGKPTVIRIHNQERLPFNTSEAKAAMIEELERVTNMGGEGLILRRHVSLWVPQRSYDLLKVKHMQDAEGIVIGYTWGKETELGSKLLGKMGSLRLRFGNIEFDLSGFTDEEREMLSSTVDAMSIDGYSKAKAIAIDEGERHQGEFVNKGFHNPRFPIGSTVTFRFRELSDSGIPKEGRYWRK